MTERKPTITVQLDANAVERIDKLADKMGLTRTKVASNLLSSGLVIVECFDKTGLIRLGSWLEDVIAKVKRHDSAVEKEQPKIERTTVTVNIPANEAEYLTQLAEKFLNTKAKLAGNIILANLPPMEKLEKIGLIGAVQWFETIKEDALKRSKGKVKGQEIAGVE